MNRALADLNLSRSIELISGGDYNNDNQHSMTSCDTAELLRTPSPCVVGSDEETEPVETGRTGAEARECSSEEPVEKDQGNQNQWAAISLIHKEKNQEFCMQINDGIQSMTDAPATSTPKKQKVNGHTSSSDNAQILEGRYEGSAYHRDGTRVGWYSFNCESVSLKNNLQILIHESKNTTSVFFSPDVQCDVCMANLPDGSSMFCVWMRRPGQQGSLLQTDRSLHDQSGASLGEVSDCKESFSNTQGWKE